MPMIHFDQNAPNPRLPVSRYARFIPNATRKIKGANGLQSLYLCGFAGAATHCKISHFAARNTQTRPPLYRGVLRCARTYSKAKRCAFLLTKYGENFAAMAGGSTGSTMDVDEFGDIHTQT